MSNEKLTTFFKQPNDEPIPGGRSKFVSPSYGHLKIGYHVKNGQAIPEDLISFASAHASVDRRASVMQALDLYNQAMKEVEPENKIQVSESFWSTMSLVLMASFGERFITEVQLRVLALESQLLVIMTSATLAESRRYGEVY